MGLKLSEHRDLAIKYFQISYSTVNPIICLSFALRSIEEIAMDILLESEGYNVYSPDTQNKMIKIIRENPELYEIYLKVLYNMSKLLMEGDFNKEFLVDLEKIINKILNYTFKI